jgi:hypothetical protein
MAGAVKVTVDPRQKGLDEAMIVTPTGNMGLTVIVTGVLVAGLPVAQKASDVSLQVTTSPVNGT